MLHVLRKLKSHKIEIITCLSLVSIFYLHSISKLRSFETFISTINHHIIHFSLADSELDKCPACFGTNICPAFKSGDLRLTGFTSWRFFQFLNVKNVFNGFWVSRNISVVIKKLGYNSELENIDKNLCKLVERDEACNLKNAMKKLVESLSMKSRYLVQFTFRNYSQLIRSDTIDIYKLKSCLMKIDYSQGIEINVEISRTFTVSVRLAQLC